MKHASVFSGLCQGIDELAGYAGQVAVFWGDDG